jgi:Fe(3+) dicitrate transport protein
VNYILRNGSEIKKPFEFETQQTIGSKGLFNTYNAVGGTKGKVHYYSFFDHRNGDGWRQNSRYHTNTGFGSLTYNMTSKFSVTTEVMHSQIRSQQAGGLTDAQFGEDAQQSLRSRNWFDIRWTTAAIIANYKVSEKARWNTKLFAVHGDRNSVGFMQAITVKDSINPATMQYNNRTLQIDNYRNYGLESRYITDYQLGSIKNTIAGGIRLYTGNTHRQADGKGTTGTEYTTQVIGAYPRDIDYVSHNAAAFVENIFHISDKFIVIPGLRYEYVEGVASGRNGYVNGSETLLQKQKKGRGFLLAGIGAEYHVSSTTEVYANYSQAYRPMQFSDLTTPPTTDVLDPNLKDAKGYNIDLGYRGKLKSYLYFDVSGFYLKYNNRIGTIAQQRADNSFYNYRTNVGNSYSKGFEGFVEFSPVKAFVASNSAHDLSIFGSYGYTNARYGNFSVITKNGNNLVQKNLKDQKVENAPVNILRTGTTYTYKGLSLTGQLSSVSEAFSDANNTKVPTANGQNGLIPSYTVIDLTATYHFAKNLNVKAGVNNAGDERYFTRRAGGYPGPGVLPADGRTFFVSFGAKL